MDATDLGRQSTKTHRASRDAIGDGRPSSKSLMDMPKEIKTMIYTSLIPEQHPVVGHKILMPRTIMPVLLVNKEMMFDVTATYFEKPTSIVKNPQDPRNLYYKTLVHRRRLSLSDIAQVRHILQHHSSKDFLGLINGLHRHFPLLKTLEFLTGCEMCLDYQRVPLTIDADTHRMICHRYTGAALLGLLQRMPKLKVTIRQNLAEDSASEQSQPSPVVARCDEECTRVWQVVLDDGKVNVRLIKKAKTDP